MYTSMVKLVFLFVKALAKDPDQESIIRSFHFWAEMAGVSRIELRHKDPFYGFWLFLDRASIITVNIVPIY